ncbi:hypothetical protein [Neisseria sicca]|uniref:hypothetical protein n=1 Tax=Neisseria sicca TaxID=490 RepID=UPI0021C11952|nr:hypothetical protein [Neisseria sicca]
MGVPFNKCVGVRGRLKKRGIRTEEKSFTVNSNKDALHRHSRAGGNPDLGFSGIFKNCSNYNPLDSRLRGNDGVGHVSFEFIVD